MIRSLVAIVLGGVVIAALGTMAGAVVVHRLPPRGAPAILLFMTLLMRTLAAVAGGYVAGSVARRRPAAHGLAAGVLYLLAIQLLAPTPWLATRVTADQPLWFAAASLGLALVGAAVGGAAQGQNVGAPTSTD